MQMAHLTEGSSGEPYPDGALRHVIVAFGLRKIILPAIILSFPPSSCSFCSLTASFQNTATWLIIQGPVYLRSNDRSMSEEMLGDDCNWPFLGDLFAVQVELENTKSNMIGVGEGQIFLSVFFLRTNCRCSSRVPLVKASLDLRLGL